MTFSVGRQIYPLALIKLIYVRDGIVRCPNTTIIRVMEYLEDSSRMI
jgi:hypothetical protein